MHNAVVLTISDSRSAGQKPDESGPAAVEMLQSLGMTCLHHAIIPDEQPRIAAALRTWSGRADVVVTTGGTGIGPRDVTPEAVAEVIDRDLPGFGEIMRVATFDRTPLSIISRGGAGVSGRTLIVYLPGSPKAVRECLSLIGPAIKHVLKVLSEPGADCAADLANRSAAERPRRSA